MVNLSSTTAVTFAVLNYLSWVERLPDGNFRMMTSMHEGGYEDAWHHPWLLFLKYVIN